MCEKISVSIETLKLAQEAVHLVYDANIAWLQIHGREAEYTKAMDELEVALESYDQEDQTGKGVGDAKDNGN